METFNLSLQEHVPEHVLRTDDDFSSGSDIESDHESENSAEDELEMDNGEEFEENTENVGWADAMAKVLKMNTPKGKKTIVLAKAKKLTEVIKAEKGRDIGFEIDGEIKEEKPDVSLDKIKTEEPKKAANFKFQKREWKLKARIKPNVLERNRERTLSKIAIKGVVQLFNTVKDHQKKINKKLNEAGTERKREKVLKSVDKTAFLDMLMGSSGAKEEERNNSFKLEADIKEEEKTSWHVLRDDFMMGASLKDWDKKLECKRNPVETKEEEPREDTDLSEEEDDDGDGGDDDDDDDDDLMDTNSFDSSGGQSSDEG